MRRRTVLLLSALLVFAAPTAAQEDRPATRPSPAASRPAVRPPTHGGVKYGPHERNVMDVWLAKSDKPTPVVVSIHGGGFLGGDRLIIPRLRDEYLANGISVVAITYRYSSQAIAPAPMRDGARAIQFIRTKAQEWNIDPT